MFEEHIFNEDKDCEGNNWVEKESPCALSKMLKPAIFSIDGWLKGINRQAEDLREIFLKS